MLIDRSAVKGAVALVASAGCLALAIVAFWYQDWVYALPTPRPEGLHQIAPGETVPIVAITGRHNLDRPLVFHVVNTDCPCSRFNRDHLRTLVRRFGGRVTFVALVQGADDPEVLRTSFESWDIAVDVVADPGGHLATMLGVYSTPQAVVVTSDGRLYFRGNYNSTRYCADRRTEFVRIAIEAVLAGRTLPAMPDDAMVAYGCPLPHRHTAGAEDEG